MHEIWKDIAEYEGKYKVSNLGNVMTIERPCENGKRILRSKLLTPRLSKTGYLQLLLYKNGGRKTWLVHKLVAAAFIDNPKKKPQVNHIDGNKKNNAATNLEWVTVSENANHAVSLGLRVAKRGENSPCSIRINQVDLSGKYIKTWGSIREAARELGLSQSHLGKCCKGNYKTSGGFKWEYAK